MCALGSYINPHKIALNGECDHLFFLNQQLLSSNSSAKYSAETKQFLFYEL